MILWDWIGGNSFLVGMVGVFFFLFLGFDN